MLDAIVSDTRTRLDALRRSSADIQRRAAGVASPPSFVAALLEPGLSVIAEIKRRSPSRGALAPDLDPVHRAQLYADGGAAAISVLTEPDHFEGSNDDLESVRDAVSVPILRKDFTIDQLQIWEARAIGASAVLLIVAILDDAILRALLSEADNAGLVAVVEVHSTEETGRALAAGARIVGVNNRDLNTFETDLAIAESIAPLLAGVDVKIGESGIHTPHDAARMADAGFDAVLVGESLVTSAAPGAAIAAFRGGDL